MAADKRVTRVVYGAFVALAAAFIVSSVWQIASQLFGFGPAMRPDAPRVGAPCAAAIQQDLLAIDLALSEPTMVLGGDEAVKVYERAKQRGWQDHDKLTQCCAGDPAAAEAIAAVIRLDKAAESAVRRRAGELGPVRREVDSFIR